MGNKDDKTNVMRILDQKKVPYEHLAVDVSGAVSGTEMARLAGQNPACVFKTLVTVGKSGGHYVFMIPVAEELDLKKAAAACGEKSIAMIAQKELLPLTGYIHGGCSPIGMKKFFPTYIDSSAMEFSEIMFSAGRIGRQVRLSFNNLKKIIPVTAASLTAECTKE